jgi:hypothetical protein
MAHRRTGKKINREPKTFYYADKGGHIMAKRAGSKGPARRTGVKVERKPRTMIFVDGQGYVCEAPLGRGRGKR